MLVTDVLRGLYVKLPRRLRALASPFISVMPPVLKYGETYLRYTNDIERSESDADFVEKYRARQLGLIVSSCFEHCTYYRTQFRQTFGEAFDGAEFSLDQLPYLPILRKETVRAAPDKFLTRKVSDVDLATTSGTSGVPLKFYLDRDRGVKEWAFVHHLWGRNGYCPGMRIAVLRGVKIPNVDKRPWEFDSALSELRLSPFHLIPEIMDKYFQLLEQYKIRFIWGYPSAISILANYALSKGWQCPSTLIGIIPISETLFPHQRELICKGFENSKILGSYGLSEKAAIAGELSTEQDVYEFEPLYGITELVDDDDVPVSEPGKSGRIIGTGFISTAMPLLRYDTGDLGELVRPASRENCYRLRIKGIKSRWGQEFIVASNGALISIAAINVHSPVYSNLHSFQFFQNTLGIVKVLVVPVRGCTKEDIQPFVDEIQAKVGENVKFSLEIVNEIAGNARGKRRFVNQKLDLSIYS